ncbi:MAG: hypothetical protein ACFFCW_40765, partial [Candidatus Hodarchaeota archaeon]
EAWVGRLNCLAVPNGLKGKSKNVAWVTSITQDDYERHKDLSIRILSFNVIELKMGNDYGKKW